jgi:hypothetical protein
MADMAGTQKLTRCGCGSFRTMSYKRVYPTTRNDKASAAPLIK